MLSSRQGTIRLFQFSGIDVFLHWSWFLVAIFEINGRNRQYSSFLWNVLEYLALFVIVMLHEFGHSLACRQVGGTANRIVLWPLGGVAYVDPPPRPGATLWSIAAGPLVNVALAPLLFGLGYFGKSMGWWVAFPNAHALLRAIYVINAGLLIFNLLPIYPLDGGQIFRSMLWFVIGRARSLMVATVTRAGWGSWIRNPGLLSTVRLVGNYCRLRAGQLLGRPAASACVTEDGETAASARFLLSEM
jgi:Zn-dependent protease